MLRAARRQDQPVPGAALPPVPFSSGCSAASNVGLTGEGEEEHGQLGSTLLSPAQE